MSVNTRKKKAMAMTVKEKAMMVSELIILTNFSSFINSYLKFKTRCLFSGNAMKNSGG